VPDHKKPKLLLADDSATIRKVVELTFADEGIEVLVCADAQSAMERFVEFQPDIVLLDVTLAGTSGYQICEMIKTDEATRNLPVLLLIGAFEPFDQDEAERVQADGFLTKPFPSIRDLVERVRDLLSMQTGGHTTDFEAEGAPSARDNGEVYSELAATQDIDILYQSSFTSAREAEEFEPVRDLFGESVLDDELIELTYPADEFREFDSDSASTAAEVADAHRSEIPRDIERYGSTATVHNRPTSSMESAVVDAPTEPGDQSNRATSGQALSPETISLIADKVLERLSDRVVREIAREAVPRIAEKLMREALEDEAKR